MMRAVCLILAATSAQAEPLRIGASLDYPPYLWVADDGDLTGLDADILSRICDIYTCDVIPTAVPDLIPALMAGEIDMVIGGIGNLPQREALVDFTCPYDPISRNDGIFVGRPDAPPPEEALISVTQDTVHALALQADGFKIRGYPDNISGIAALANGEADLYFGSTDPIALAQEELGTSFAYQGSHPLPPLGAAMAVADGNDALRSVLNGILADMSRSGELEAAQAYWLGRSQPDTIADCDQQQLNSKQGDIQ